VVEEAQALAGFILADKTGGKSGLRRTGWFLTGTGGDPRDKCHRKQTACTPSGAGKGETVR